MKQNNVDFIKENIQIQKIATSINNFILSYDFLKNRENKSNIRDAILFRLLYAKNEASGRLITRQLIKSSYDDNSKMYTQRQSYMRKENNINIDFYVDLLKYVQNMNVLKMDNKYNKTILLVDGSHGNYKATKENKPFHLSNGKITDSLITGIYDVNYRLAIKLEFAQYRNETEAFIKILNDNPTYSHINIIYVCDRAYFCDKLLNVFNKIGTFYILRLKKNYKFIQHNKNDYIVKYNNNTLRVIKYEHLICTNEKCEHKNENECYSKYYLATNLFDKTEYSINILSQMYHERWSIEEYFKHLKLNYKFSHNEEHSHENTIKTLHADLIVQTLCRHIETIIRKEGNIKDTLNINQKLLFDGFINSLLIPLIKNKLNKNIINSFILSSIEINKKRHRKSYDRKSFRPNTKWYQKSYVRELTKKKYFANKLNNLLKKEEKLLKIKQELKEKQNQIIKTHFTQKKKETKLNYIKSQLDKNKKKLCDVHLKLQDTVKNNKLESDNEQPGVV